MQLLASFSHVVIAGGWSSVDWSVDEALADSDDAVTLFRANAADAPGVSAAIVQHGRDVGSYRQADVVYTAACSGAAANIPFALCAARAEAPLLVA